MSERESTQSFAERVVDTLISGLLNTAMPGQIVEFDAATCRATIQPCLQRKYVGVDDPVTLPPIQDVPVLMFGSGDRWMTVDLAKDSYVLLIFAQRSIANWLESGGVANPGLSRKFHLSDAIAIAGLIPATDVLDTSISAEVIGFRSRDGNTVIQIAANDDVEITSDGGSGDVVLNEGSGTAVEYSRLKTAYDQLRSDLNTLIGTYNTHVHSGVTTGTGSSGTPGSAAIPSTADMSGAESGTIKLP